MKTIREIANELGVDKQKVYRFIKQNHINEAHHEALQRSGVKYYDEAAETLIKQGFSDETASSEAHHEAHQNRINEAVFDAVIEMLQKELEIKNEQIKELNERLSECSAALLAAQQTTQAAQVSRSFTTLYDTMWEKAGTNSSGTTSNGNEAPAAKAFMEDLGYSCSYDSYLFDSYSDFTRDLGNNKPCIFTYGAKFGSKSGGHAVLAVGYVETTKYQYLRIADGWNDYLRYINFNGYDYTRKDGWSFSVSK